MISEELLQSFIAEASDLLDDVEPSLVEYSRLMDVDERTEIVNRVFRHFHSIKGSAGFVSLHNIARLTHEAETLLEQYRKNPDKIIPQENIALLCQTVDLLRAIFDSGDGDNEDGGGAGIDALIKAISAATQSVKSKTAKGHIIPNLSVDSKATESPDAAQDVIPAHQGLTEDKPQSLPEERKTAFTGTTKTISNNTGTPTSPKPGGIAGSRRLPSDTARIIHAGKPLKQDRLTTAEFAGRYVSEANELLEQIEQSLLYAEQHPESSADSVQDALRCLHSFKGNSGFMNLTDLGRLSHRMESELESAIDHSLGLDSQTFDVLLQMIDILRQGVVDFSCGGSGAIPETDAYIAMMGEMSKTMRTDTRVATRTAIKTPPRAERPPDPFPAIDVASPALEFVPSRDEPARENGGPKRDSSTGEAAPPETGKKEGNGTTRLVLRGGTSQQVDLRSMPKSDSINIAASPDSDTEVAFNENPCPPASAKDQKPMRETGEVRGIAIAKNSDSGQKRRSSEQLTARSDIRVDLRKLDAMLDLVGELVIAEAMVTRHPVVWDAESESLERAVHQLRRVAGSLQDMATSVRMIPLAPTFRRMTRLVYDLSVKAGKQVDLILLGEETEVDRTVIERISDPLVHIIRNAIDHGIESPAERLAIGKPETGRLTIEGHHEGGEVWIVITDDGCGLNKQAILQKAISRDLINGDGSELSDNQIYHFIFEPGFSTTNKVTDISGRGFGMNVVRKNIEKLSGKIDIRTRPGEGTAVVLRIPLTLAIIEGMLISAGDTRYIIPLLSIRESLRPDPSQIMSTPDGQQLVKIRDELIPIVKLDETFSRVKSTQSLADGILMIVEGEDEEVIALFADELLGQQETVIKGLSGWLKKSRGVSGCTILGDGEVGLILDIGAIVRLARQKFSA